MRFRLFQRRPEEKPAESPVPEMFTEEGHDVENKHRRAVMQNPIAPQGAIGENSYDSTRLAPSHTSAV